jgi:hypothetical protein
MTSSWDLTQMVKEGGPRRRAFVEWLEKWDDTATTDPDEGGGEELGQQLAGQLGARIVPRQGKSRNIQSFGKNFIIESTDISSFCKKLLGNTI